jgi:serine/threonine protein kinase
MPEPSANTDFAVDQNGAATAETVGRQDAATTSKPDANADPNRPSTWTRGVPPRLPARFGRYELRRLIGQGGMGAVYLAQDMELDRPVALKIPAFSEDDRSAWLERFLREARLAANLSHANLCPVYDFGQIEGIFYLTMAYIEGRTLADVIREYGNKIPQRQIASMVRQVALALHDAHSQGVIHRDLKPSNIIINKKKLPIIMDFGLARRTFSRDQARLTQNGELLGTPTYMPPEQINGDLEKIGPTCDVYSLGVIMYELLTGHVPFDGGLGHLLTQILLKQIPPIRKFRPNVDARLEAICLKAMQKNIEDRFGSMDEMALALGYYLRDTDPERSALAGAGPTSDGVAVGGSSKRLPEPVPSSGNLATPAAPRRPTPAPAPPPAYSGEVQLPVDLRAYPKAQVIHTVQTPAIEVESFVRRRLEERAADPPPPKAPKAAPFPWAVLIGLGAVVIVVLAVVTGLVLSAVNSGKKPTTAAGTTELPKDGPPQGAPAKPGGNAPARLPAVKVPRGWKERLLADRGLKVVVPDNLIPDPAPKVIRSSGRALNVDTVSLCHLGVNYWVGSSPELNRDLSTEERNEFYKSFAEVLAKEFKTEPFIDNPLTLYGRFPARDVQFQLDEDAALVRAYIFATPRRIFVAITKAPRDEENLAAMQAFLDGLRPVGE